jgi:HD-like signal output (HDOD) protein
VLSWLRSVLSSPSTKVPDAVVCKSSPASDVAVIAPPRHVGGAVPAQRMLDASEVAFLDALCSVPVDTPLEDLEGDDRIFVEGFADRLERQELDLPRLPQVAIKLGQMLREGDKPVSEYVKLLNEDPSLSVEVLRAANSAMFAASTTTSSLQEAVLRIGVARLQSILMMAHMKSRILKSGAFQQKAELLLDLALPTGMLASRFATDNEPADERFMRGMLMHVEHLVIIGAISDIAREHRTAVHPSVDGMHVAFHRFGASVRGAIASAWELTELLTGGDDAATVAAEYASFRYAVICRWLGRSLPPLPGVDANRLGLALAHVPARVVRKPEAAIQ